MTRKVVMLAIAVAAVAGCAEQWTRRDATYDQNPSARAAFGVHKGSEEVIFIREYF